MADSRFENAQRELIEEEIAKAVDNIAQGQMTQEIYRFEAGKIAGMRQVLGYSDEVNKKISDVTATVRVRT